MVILGSVPHDNWETNLVRKRKRKDHANMTRSLRRLPLTFSDRDLLLDKANDNVPLMIYGTLVQVDVRRIPVDQGSFVYVIFKGLLPRLNTSVAKLSPYQGDDLISFNSVDTKPIGNITLVANYVARGPTRSVETHFLILPCFSPYNFIIERPTLGELGAVASMVHLKMTFHSLCGNIITISVDLEAAKCSHYLAARMGRRELHPKRVLLCANSKAIITNLDSKYDPDTSDDENDDQLTREFKKKIRRPEPDGEFIKVPLGEDPSKTFKIGSNVRKYVEDGLVRCLREHAKLLAWSAADMPGIPPEVACHRLSVKPEAKWVA